MSASHNFLSLFENDKPVIGMVHVWPLPGTAAYQSYSSALNHAIEEAMLLEKSGVDGIIIENMFDTPYVKREVGPEITASMTMIAGMVRQNVECPCGVQVLAGANKAALAVAKAANFDFIRAEGFVFAHVADEGLMESDAGELLRYRKAIDAEEIFILTDIKKKHSAHQLTADLGITDWAKAADFFMSDGLILTGNHTGEPAKPSDLTSCREVTDLPLIVGSGMNAENLDEFYAVADAFIVGSHFKENGDWKKHLEEDRINGFMEKIKALRG